MERYVSFTFAVAFQQVIQTDMHVAYFSQFYIVRIDVPPGVEVPGGCFVTVESGPHRGFNNSLQLLKNSPPRPHTQPDIIFLETSARVWALDEAIPSKPRIIISSNTVKHARDNNNNNNNAAIKPRPTISSRQRSPPPGQIVSQHTLPPPPLLAEPESSLLLFRNQRQHDIRNSIASPHKYNSTQEKRERDIASTSFTFTPDVASRKKARRSSIGAACTSSPQKESTDTALHQHRAAACINKSNDVGSNNNSEGAPMTAARVDFIGQQEGVISPLHALLTYLSSQDAAEGPRKQATSSNSQEKKN